ncbi:Hypothetical protein LUCI_3971 [Lucifera butyrica]|uniref:Uncharacterized protein n=1 Tax=Lucifera butyrica TaxID=1351585 RepID=A0A498RF29_9FIRM|nr:hypothetical protein [Lucifera butyrica]VBB08693.1 Hypothetical protein LUCI_3971 [Lucifera butyrica]
MDVKQRIEERHLKQAEQLERWHSEQEHNQEIENQLAALSKFSYEAVDYEPFLVRTPWKEPPLTDYSYLVEEAQLKAESAYIMPLAVRTGLLLLLLTIVVISGNAAAFWVAGTAGTALAVSLYLKVVERKKMIVTAVNEAQLQVKNKEEEERKKNEAAKKAHENTENERIAAINRLLNGELGAVILRLDEVLTNLRMPVLIEVDIDIHKEIPLLRIWLPAKMVIPRQRSTLLSSGRIQYEDKEIRKINQQYLELCSAVISRILAIVYGNIPSFDVGYVWGMIKDGPEDECIVMGRFDRQAVIDACRAASGITALKALQAEFDYDQSLNFFPQKARWPEEWGEAEHNMLRSLHVKIFK